MRYRFTHDYAKPRNYVKPAKKTSSNAVTQESLLWPDGTRTSADAPDEVEARTIWSTQAVNFTDAASDSYAVSPIAAAQYDLGPATSSWPQNEGDVEDVTDTTSTAIEPFSLEPCYGRDVNNNISRSLVTINAKTRELFDYFSTNIAPIMVVVDSSFNGYRNLILPLACENDLVKGAVSVASLHHLAPLMPELQQQADRGFQRILGQLRQRTSSRSDLMDIPAWTTLIVLLTAETITGGNNLPYLFRILQHLATANAGDERKSVMHTFLSEQTRMMTLLGQPLLEEGTGAISLANRSEDYFDFVSNVAIFQPTLAWEISLYKIAIHRACNIYITRATINPPHCETVADLEELKLLCEQIHPSTPGHHTLVWPYFIAAAESSTLAHRQFFTMRLQEVYSRTRFHNIPVALTALQEVWKVQSKRRWTEIISEVMPVFII